MLQNVGSTLLQADGSYLFENRVVLTGNGTWTAPAGVSKIRYILVENGEDGEDGKDGDWDSTGENGKDGEGGKIKSETVGINEQQVFSYSVGQTTVLGPYSSSDGEVYPYGFTDIASGDVYGRTGVKSPLPGSGDGGVGGAGGEKGNRHTESSETAVSEVIDNYPGRGEPGSKGGTGCIVIWYDKPEADL